MIHGYMRHISSVFEVCKSKLSGVWAQGLAKVVAIATIAVMALFTVSFPAYATTHEVKMGSDTGMIKFVPESLTIQPGDTVRWVMNKVPPHNVMFEGNNFPNSDTDLAKNLSHKQLLYGPGESYESTFPQDAATGTYPYYCEPHRGAGMSGKIIVEEG